MEPITKGAQAICVLITVGVFALYAVVGTIDHQTMLDYQQQQGDNLTMEP